MKVLLINGSPNEFGCTYTALAEAQKVFEQNGIETEETPLWDYPLNEIDHIVENNLNVVLVEIGYFDENDYLQKEFRWFEVPENMIEKFN
jgi:NAD(P)H-dependent FMN reductase